MTETPWLARAGERLQRLQVTQSNFAAAIRGCQLEGLSGKQIGDAVGLSADEVDALIRAWGLGA